jgi:hypothetical protein
MGLLSDEFAGGKKRNGGFITRLQERFALHLDSVARAISLTAAKNEEW